LERKHGIDALIETGVMNKGSAIRAIGIEFIADDAIAGIESAGIETGPSGIVIGTNSPPESEQVQAPYLAERLVVRRVQWLAHF
jgi:hypothetical protein